MLSLESSKVLKFRKTNDTNCPPSCFVIRPILITSQQGKLYELKLTLNKLNLNEISLDNSHFTEELYTQIQMDFRH